MGTGETIQYLRAMEQQVSQVNQCDSRKRSINSSMKALKQKQALLRLPSRPTYELPKTMSGFEFVRAFIVGFLCFFIPAAVYSALSGGGRDSDNIVVVVVLLVISLFAGFIAGKKGEEERKRKAEAAEAERVRTVNQQRVAAYDAQKRNIETRQQELVRQIRQLNADYQKVSQTREQELNKLVELGRALRLHSDYWSPYALSHIRGLLERGRADTLKEAINRYEDEKSQREHRERMEDAAWEEVHYSRQQAQYQQEQAEYARQAAEYGRQQANHAAATRRTVEDMKRQQDWDRFWGN